MDNLLNQFQSKHSSVESRMAAGKVLRKKIPRIERGKYEPATDCAAAISIMDRPNCFQGWGEQNPRQKTIKKLQPKRGSARTFKVPTLPTLSWQHQLITFTNVQKIQNNIGKLVQNIVLRLMKILRSP
jgi:hypothetical protein